MFIREIAKRIDLSWYRCELGTVEQNGKRGLGSYGRLAEKKIYSIRAKRPEFASSHAGRVALQRGCSGPRRHIARAPWTRLMHKAWPWRCRP